MGKKLVCIAELTEGKLMCNFCILQQYLAALPDDVKQIITEAFTLIAART